MKKHLKRHLHRLRQLRFGPKTVAGFQFGVLLFFLVLFFWWIHPNKQTETIPAEQATTTAVAFFPPVEIEAKSAYVYDVRTGKVLYEKDAELQLPLASLTKLMTVYAASTLIPEYVMVRIESDDLLEEGDTGLKPGETWKLQKLIDYSLITSSNDGMHALSSIAGSQISSDTTTPPRTLFIERMNQIAGDLGLRETYFLNPSGLDLTPELSGGYGSAKDTALLVEHILRENPHLLEGTTYHKTTISSDLFWHYAENTNKAILNIPNILASKTGFTDLSGGNVVVAWNAGLNRPIIVAVLGSSFNGRFDDLSKLTSATVEYLAQIATSTDSQNIDK